MKFKTSDVLTFDSYTNNSECDLLLNAMCLATESVGRLFWN